MNTNQHYTSFVYGLVAYRNRNHYGNQFKSDGNYN